MIHWTWYWLQYSGHYTAVTGYDTLDLILAIVQWTLYCCNWLLYSGHDTGYGTVDMILAMVQWTWYWLWYSGHDTDYGTVDMILTMVQWTWYWLWYSGHDTGSCSFQWTWSTDEPVQWTWYWLWYSGHDTDYGTVDMILAMVQWTWYWLSATAWTWCTALRSTVDMILTMVQWTMILTRVRQCYMMSRSSGDSGTVILTSVQLRHDTGTICTVEYIFLNTR